MADNKSFITKGEFDTELNKKSDKITYSTSEVDTGNKWIDGKTIYRKVYTGNYGTKGFSLGITIAQLIKTTVVVKFGSSFRLLPYLWQENQSFSVGFYISSDSLFIVGSNEMNNSPFICILEYTKPS